MPSKNPRISVTVTQHEYEQIQRLASVKAVSMGEICRQYIIQGLNGTITQDNIDFLVPIIRDQLQSLLTPSVERLAKISTKACVQAGAAAYLSAEALSKFVPEEYQINFEEAYEAARKKSVRYLKGKTDLSKE